MGILKSIFTWWEGATIGTALWSRRNGREVGRDSLGNIYLETKPGGRRVSRRWVIYNGPNDASRIPPEWFGWMHHQIDVPPTELPAPRAWQKPPVPNLTGTPDAFRPKGAIEEGGRRAAATGDYEAWTPN